MINTYVDDVMRLLLKELNINVLPYNPNLDPTRLPLSNHDAWQEEFTKREWTIGPRAVNSTRKRLADRLETKVKPKPNNKKAKVQDLDDEEEKPDLIHPSIETINNGGLIKTEPPPLIDIHHNVDNEINKIEK